MFQLYIINNLNDPYIELVKDDPVRPEIPITFRCADNRRVLVLLDQDQRPCAVVCALLLDRLPRTVEDLYGSVEQPTHCVFYTIWSYVHGAGRELIQRTLEWFKSNHSDIQYYVTLSPVTDMARRFHLGNGAEVFSVNDHSINYLYR